MRSGFRVSLRSRCALLASRLVFTGVGSGSLFLGGLVFTGASGGGLFLGCFVFTGASSSGLFLGRLVFTGASSRRLFLCRLVFAGASGSGLFLGCFVLASLIFGCCTLRGDHALAGKFSRFRGCGDCRLAMIHGRQEFVVLAGGLPMPVLRRGRWRVMPACLSLLCSGRSSGRSTGSAVVADPVSRSAVRYGFFVGVKA